MESGKLNNEKLNEEKYKHYISGGHYIVIQYYTLYRTKEYKKHRAGYVVE